MKIGIITDAIDDEAAGIGTYVRNLVPNVIALDKKNEYYLIHHKKSDNQFYMQFNKNKKVHEIIIPIKRIPFGREIRKILIMPKILDSYGLDIVHETAQIGPFFTKTNYKKIVSIMDIVPLILPETQPFLAVIHHKIGLPIIIKRVDKIITISENTKKDLMKQFDIDNKKISSILIAAQDTYKKIKREGSNRKNFEEKYKIREPYFLFVSTLEPRKNIPRLLRAFAEIKKTGIKHKLIIIGKKGWKYQEIFTTYDELQLKDEVIFLEKVNSDDLIMFYNFAEALVYPSLYEGFGIPPLEAMMCGCPVITSKTSSIPEVVGTAAIRIDPRNIHEISEAMMSILENKKMRKELIKKGLTQSRKFSWKETAKKTLEIYKELAS